MYTFILSSLLLWSLIDIDFVISAVYYVNPSAPISKIGSSWNEPFNNLDEALQSATSVDDQIWLKSGTYYPSNPSNRSDCFVTSYKITIYGGFNGNENSINGRDAADQRPESIISGDIGILGDNSDNCYHVIKYNVELTLDSVIIQDGNANYNGDYSSLQINVLDRYGGALITTQIYQRTEIHLQDVTIRNNTAINGGGIFVASTENQIVDVIIKDSKFENNQAINGIYEGGYGGAIYTMYYANVSIINTRFENNYADFKGGAVYQDYGAHLYSADSTFRYNTVNGWGGAIFSEDRNSQTSGTFPVVKRSYFSNNFAGIYGGAICFYNGVVGVLENNNFNMNTANNLGGAVAIINSQLITDTGNSYSGNTANGDNSTKSTYNEPDFLYDSIDNTLSYNLTKELEDLYATFISIPSSKRNIYPFSQSTDLCYVDGDNMGGTKTGISWNEAYTRIQDCLDDLSISGNGGEIWVATGTYFPTKIPDWKESNNIEYRSFELYDGIRMYGGFIGNETQRRDRNFKNNPTYLSCQLSSNTQCYQIINSADDTLIDGFILTNAGSGSSTQRRLANSLSISTILSSVSSTSGSGIWSNSTTISIVNVIFNKLLATGKGGGVYCIGLQGQQDVGIYKSPYFLNVKFLGNRAAERGGAISADVGCNFICEYCEFDSNSCSKKGGAIYLDFASDIQISNSIFTNNYALESGGCIAADGVSFTIFNGTNNKFNSNHAYMEGGCLYSGSGVGLGFKQGFQFNTLPNFTNNYMDNMGIGQSNIYGWPYTEITIQGTSMPTTSMPTTTMPTTTNPTSVSPTSSQPTTSQPTNSQVTPVPTTATPTTDTPTTDQPTTTNPTSSSPTTTSPTTTSPTTAAPNTAVPTTNTPTTSAPTTIEPTTFRPTTMEPTTTNPTGVPVTKSPTMLGETRSPTTNTPTTNTPTTNKPTTNKPITNKPTTSEPTTKSPTTTSPTTASPSTGVPITSAPTMLGETRTPTTDSPTTDSPTTDSPTTDSPTTDSPTTMDVTSDSSGATYGPSMEPTMEPTTVAPTTITPTTITPTTTIPTNQVDDEGNNGFHYQILYAISISIINMIFIFKL